MKSSLWVSSHVKRLGEFRRFPQLAGKLSEKFDVAVIGIYIPSASERWH